MGNPKPLKASDTEGGYKPTAEERKNVKRVKGMFKLSGDGVFHTIQGEGDRAGRPTTFVRLHMCNLACSWCDAWYTWKQDTPEYWREPKNVTHKELNNLIRVAQEEKGISSDKHVRNITFTGGEPLLQGNEIEKFMESYPQYKVQIETNGTIPVNNRTKIQTAKFNCSPKITNSLNKEKLRFREGVLRSLCKLDIIFKFVVKTVTDVIEVEKKYGFLPKDKVWLMPEGVTVEENMQVFEKIMPAILRSGYNVACRNQNVMWDGALRGV